MQIKRIIFQIFCVPTKDVRKNHSCVMDPFVQSDQNKLSIDKWRKTDRIVFISVFSLHEIFKSDKNVGRYWINFRNEYLSSVEEALKILVTFQTTYLYENGFFIMTAIKKMK